MKQKAISLSVLVFILTVFSREASAQKMMMLNENLKANSQALPVKIRGGSLMKHDFGVYKTISAKAGWSSTKSSTKIFSGNEATESKQKSNIEITANEKDTASINIALNIKSEAVRDKVISFSKDRVAWEREEEPSKYKERRNLVAVITTSMDTTTWNYVQVDMVNSENAQENINNAFLTDGNRRIDIKRVSKWDNGKSPTLYFTVGFELYIDGVVVAAVQNPMDTFQKKYVWIKSDSDEKTKLIIAAAAVILLSFTNQVPA